MDFLTHAEKRWSCRSYADTPVEQEKLDAVLEAARIAPTAKNQQPFHIWIVRSEEAIARIDETTNCRYGAPIVLIVAADPKRSYVRSDGRDTHEIDASIVGTHILLEAQDQGLSTVWIAAYDSEKLNGLFPELGGYTDVALIALGYAAEDAQPAPRHTESKPIEELVSVL